MRQYLLVNILLRVICMQIRSHPISSYLFKNNTFANIGVCKNARPLQGNSLDIFSKFGIELEPDRKA